MNTSLIQTLTIKQLLECWPEYSAQNIYELADEGHFGLYVKSLVTRKSYTNISDHIDKLLTSTLTNEKEKKYYIELQNKFHAFAKTHPSLLKPKQGYQRLATTVETIIFQGCETTSIQRLKDFEKIWYEDFNNTFGFIIDNHQIVAPSYYLVKQPIPGIRGIDSNYKGHFDQTDIFIFIDEFKHFQSNNKRALTANPVSKTKQKQIRTSELIVLIKRVYRNAQDKTPKAIWQTLINIDNDAEETVIQVITEWGAHNASIKWISCHGTEQKMGKPRFRNLISTLKKQL